MTASWAELKAPPRLSAQDAADSRRLHRGRAAFSLRIGPHTLDVTLASPREVQSMGDPVVKLLLRVGGGLGQLAMPKALARLLSDFVGGELPDEHPDFDLIAEAALADPVNALESRLGRKISFSPPGERLPPDLTVLGFHLFRGGVRLGLALLRLPSQDVAALTDLLETLPEMLTAIDTLPAQIIVEAGFIELSVSALRGLRPGDVLLSDDPMPLDHVRFVIDGQRTHIGQRTAAGFEVAKEDGRRKKGPIDMTASEDRENPGATLEELNVKIVFEAGRCELPIGELQRIRPGYVLELDRPAGLAVDLTVRGQIIGKGELVQIDNGLGCRIMRLFGHE